MQALTLPVILRAVFGYEPGPAENELGAQLRAFIEPIAEARSLKQIIQLVRRRQDPERVRKFVTGRRAADALLLAEIARRRALPEAELESRTDVFSALLLARDEGGERLTDAEVRDELMTLLLAGHETTANGLAWAFDLLLHDPEVLQRARQGDDAYLDAVAKETLRLRAVIPGVGRIVRGGPFALGDWILPPGTVINPSIRMIHRRADLYPQPEAFRPERFLGDRAPDTYTWLPFGGGTRRCIGASFAAMEMRVVLRRVLQRASLRAASPKREKPRLRFITVAPRDGTLVIRDHN
jgi:cytochrome P450